MDFVIESRNDQPIMETKAAIFYGPLIKHLQSYRALVILTPSFKKLSLRKILSLPAQKTSQEIPTHTRHAAFLIGAAA